MGVFQVVVPKTQLIIRIMKFMYFSNTVSQISITVTEPYLYIFKGFIGHLDAPQNLGGFIT